MAVPLGGGIDTLVGGTLLCGLSSRVPKAVCPVANSATSSDSPARGADIVWGVLVSLWTVGFSQLDSPVPQSSVLLSTKQSKVGRVYAQFVKTNVVNGKLTRYGTDVRLVTPAVCHSPVPAPVALKASASPQPTIRTVGWRKVAEKVGRQVSYSHRHQGNT